MKIVFNGSWMGKSTFGVSRYAENILNAMDELLNETNTDTTVEILVPSGRELMRFKHIKIVINGKCKNKFEKIKWEQHVFPSYVRSQNAVGVDLTLSLPISGVDYVALHDCIYEAFPENYHGHQMHRRMYLIKARIVTGKRRTRIITVSNESKKEIQKYYGVPDDRICVIGNGWEHMNRIEADSSIFETVNIPEEKEYFFSLGSKYKHKNIDWIVAAAENNKDYYFVATGTDKFSDVIDNLQKKKPENLIFTGYVSDGQMKALMLNCKALIQPSYYEGFGIPPLEALSLGREIIVSNASCLPEIFEGSAHYIDPDNADVLLDDVLKSKTYGIDAVLKKHTWKGSAQQMMHLLGII